MYLHDVAHSSSNPNDTAISAANATSLVLDWTSQLTNVPPIGSVIAASAEVVNNTVYVGAWDGNMSAINATTGKVLWHTYLGQTNSTNAPSCSKTPRGITSSAAIYNGTVYVGGGNDYWYALNATTGMQEWNISVGDINHGNYNWASPIIYDGYEYIGVSSDCDKPLVRGELMQVSLETHHAVDTFYTVPSGKLGGTIWTTPTFDIPDNEIFVATGNCAGNNYNESPYCGAVIALKLGDISQVVGSWQDRGCTVDDCDLPTSPTLFQTDQGVRMVSVGDKAGNVFAFKTSDISSGPVWTRKVANGGDIETGKGLAATGVFTGKYVVYAGQAITIGGKTYAGSIAALNTSTGKIVWQTPLPYSESTWGATVYQNGAIIEGGGNLNNFSGALFLLNATTGAILWHYDTSGLFYDSATVALGRIFIGDYLGTLFSFGLPSSLHISSFTATPSTLYLGESTLLSTRIAGEAGPVTYVYSGLPAGCHSANVSSLLCAPAQTGTFVVTVNVTDANGGSDQAQTTLTVGQPYTVTFNESGLTSGTSWSVTLNGTPTSSMGSSVVFTVTNGSYNFTVGNVTGFVATPSNGTINVSGAPAIQEIQWTPVPPSRFVVAFTETGLASGTSWSVTLKGTVNSSTSATIDFSEPNGTYPYTIGSVTGYTTPVPSGSVTVSGSPVPVDVPWSQNSSVYSVTFTESGLASGTRWSVTLNGIANLSSNTSIEFSEPNGSYAFNVGAIAGYVATPASGVVPVVGKDVSQAIDFAAIAAPLYILSVQETGLPSGTSWSVQVNGTPFSSSSPTIAVQRANGTYGVTVNGIAGFRADVYSLSVRIAGSNVTRTVAWSTATYSVSFTEMGLSNASTWFVTLNGTLLSSRLTTITFTEANGSYDYSVGPVSGYSATPTSGSVPVQGKNLTEPVVFTAQTGGAGAGNDYGGLGIDLLIVAVVLAAVGVVAFVLTGRRRRATLKPLTPVSPPKDPWRE